MKKSRKPIYIAVALVLATLVLVLVGCTTQASVPTDTSGYLRLHVRADSDSQVDQTVKLAVRDAVLEYLTPIATNCSDKEEMQRAMQSRLGQIERVADGVLAAQNMPYTSHAYLRRETFPTRTYGDLTLAAGDYDALVVELGSGQGANWWCVAFPPLCFVAGEETDSDKIEYRSVLAEWWRKLGKAR